MSLTSTVHEAELFEKILLRFKPQHPDLELFLNQRIVQTDNGLRQKLDLGLLISVEDRNIRHFYCATNIGDMESIWGNTTLNSAAYDEALPLLAKLHRFNDYLVDSIERAGRNITVVEFVPHCRCGPIICSAYPAMDGLSIYHGFTETSAQLVNPDDKTACGPFQDAPNTPLPLSQLFRLDIPLSP